jgi:D-alanine--poly(phosphoribitol) ligase subunit 1
MQLYKLLGESIVKNAERNAFYINETFYTYADFAKSISSIRKSVQSSISETDKHVGLIANDDLETYAAIVALWLEGKAYVPIGTDIPEQRNELIIDQAGIKSIIDSSVSPLLPKYNVILSKNLPDAEINLIPKSVTNEDLCFILFTSGTTGIPKGVPINIANLEAFLNAMEEIGIIMDEKDRVLQMFEITFDMSVASYLMPLLKGGCVYTIPKGQIKYIYIYHLIEEHDLTVLSLIPSILMCMRPYFKDIHPSTLRYTLLAGEALPVDLTEEWSQSTPDGEIVNVYGPTESTIFCTSYHFKKNQTDKSYNGIVCIGKPMSGVETIIIDENKNILPPGEKGELCLAGKLLTNGYWNNDDRNKEAFFMINYKNRLTRFYRTGDLGFEDASGDIMYLGRIDFQRKIQGYRVELSEVEFYVKLFLGKINLVAVALANKIEDSDIGLAFESNKFDTNELIDFLKIKLPHYMIPTKFIFEKAFPLNRNSKIDRNELKRKFKEQSLTEYIVRKATLNDVSFLAQVIVAAEKATTDKLSYSTLFDLPESKVIEFLISILKEGIDGCEFSLSSYLVVEFGDKPVAAFAGWIEGFMESVPSKIIKSNLINCTFPKDSLKALVSRSDIISDILVEREKLTLQFEYGYVDKEHRGKHLLELLINKLIENAISIYPDLKKVQFQCFKNSTKTVHLFEKLGYQIVSEISSKNNEVLNYLPDKVKLVMEKNLN